jgi:hypothetical protein
MGDVLGEDWSERVRIRIKEHFENVKRKERENLIRRENTVNLTLLLVAPESL